MTDQIASITLRADVSDLRTASNELDKLGQAAAGAVGKADNLNSVFRAGADSGKLSSQGLKEQQNALRGLLENIDPVTKALNRLEEQQDALKSFRGKLSFNTEDFEHYQKILDATRTKLLDTGEAAARAQIELATTQAAEKQSAALKNLLGSIDPTTRAFNSLDEQHAQLVAHFESGRINGAQFEHFNTILSKTRERLSGVADALPEALSRQEAAARRAGISVGQYSAALRTLPAQFTDIATQLAGGQSPFLILLQQGGQIKDSFGGFGAMFQALRDALFGFNTDIERGADEASESVGDLAEGFNNTSEAAEKLGRVRGLVTPLNLSIVGLAAAAGILAYAWYKATEEIEELNQSLILTGNYAGVTAGQLSHMAKAISQAGSTQGEAIDVLAKVVSTGTFRASQLEIITKTALDMEEATGKSVDETIKNFQKLFASPTKVSAELNSTMHYLTASQFEYISALERRGDREGAAEAAAKAYSQAEQQRAQATLDNMGMIERAANRVGNAAKNMWDELLNVGRNSDFDKLQNMKDTLAELESNSKQGIWGRFKNNSMMVDKSALIENIRNMEFVIKSQEGYAAVAHKTKQANDDAISGQQELNKFLEAGTTKTERHAQALAHLNKLIADNARQAKDTQYAPAAQRIQLWSDADIARARKGIDEMYKSAKTAKTPAIKVSAGDRGFDSSNAETLTLQAQLKTLQEHRDINDVISQQRKQQWELISKITILEAAANDPKGRALTLDEKSLLASRERLLSQADINAGLGDQIAKQQKLNSLSDQAIKFGQQQAAKQAEIAAAAQGTSAREAERAATRQRLTEAYAFNPEAQRKVLADQEETYRKEDELRQDWQAGAKRAWADYADSATNTYENVRSVAGATFSGLSDMLSDLATTGTANFKQFARSILKMITDVTSRLLIVYGIQQALGWINGAAGGGTTPGGAYANAANSGTSLFANGAVLESPGLHQYVNGIYDSPQHFTFQGAAKFAKGGVFGEAGPEAIMPLTRDSAGRLGVRAQGGGSSGHQINVDIYVDNKGNATTNASGNGDAAARALADRIKFYVSDGIRMAIKDDGAIGQRFAKK
ncbi:MAG: phage tail tape measure protein [Hafnia sp.]